MRAILTYHSIDGSGSPVSCTPEAFDRHLRWLDSGRVRVTTIEELVSLPESVDAVALTFDDGFSNFAEIAAPRLLARGFSSTVFVVADRVGATNVWDAGANLVPRLPLLDWDGLAKLHAQGVNLGSHGRTHADLTRLSLAAIEEEVNGSADVIERRTGSRPTLFAYPYGRVDARASMAVAHVFRFACTTEFHTLEADVAPTGLPRLDAYYFQRPGLLEAWGSPAFERFVERRRRLRWLRRAAGDAARRALGPRTV